MNIEKGDIVKYRFDQNYYQVNDIQGEFLFLVDWDNTTFIVNIDEIDQTKIIKEVIT